MEKKSPVVAVSAQVVDHDHVFLCVDVIGRLEVPDPFGARDKVLDLIRSGLAFGPVVVVLVVVLWIVAFDLKHSARARRWKGVK